MKRLASRLAWWHMLPHKSTRAVNAAERRGQPWTILASTCTRGKARFVYSGRGGRVDRAADPDRARALRGRARRAAPGADPARGLDGQPVGGALSRAAGARGHRRRSQLRASGRDADPQGEDGPPGHPRAGGGGPARGVPPGASAVRSPTACARPPDRPRRGRAHPNPIHFPHPGASPPAGLPRALWQRRGLPAPGARHDLAWPAWSPPSRRCLPSCGTSTPSSRIPTRRSRA